MNPTRVLYVASSTAPFLAMPPLSDHVSNLSETMTLSPEHQVRLLLPRFGVIDQRTNSIYETIRLSGINIPIGKDRISLVVKVPSVRGVKTPIYFIDNEELFERKGVFTDPTGKFYKDNDVRALFFCKSVLAILEKLAWIPHVIHCHGWMSAFLPIYLKRAYVESHPLRQTKSIYTLYEDAFEEQLSEDFFKHVRYKQVKTAEIEKIMPERQRCKGPLLLQKCVGHPRKARMDTPCHPLPWMDERFPTYIPEEGLCGKPPPTTNQVDIYTL